MKTKFRFSYTQIIALGFLSIILCGAILLSLPISSRAGQSVPFSDAIFTATSATCVTGLVVSDTYLTWSLFGQLVILALIQIGGLGFMSVITMFSIFLRRRISLHERRLLMQSAGTMRISGVVRLIKEIMLGTLLFEGLGTVVLALRFCPEMGFAEGLYNALFHSVSAFCNAGFDIMGKFAPFSSFTRYYNDVVVNITLMALIIIGGLGFIVWNDILTHRFRFKEYELHSKIVLFITSVLILGGTVLFAVFEHNSAFKGMSSAEMILSSFFQAVTPRTAGFNTIDINSLSDSGRILTIILMFIGGSPGSTAGGIKTTTFIVLILSTISASRHTNSITIFHKRLEKDIVKQACAIFSIYMLAVLTSVLIICAVDTSPSGAVIFEVVSAVGTVGLSSGATGMLGGFSRILLMILMFSGRVGGLTLMLSLAEKRVNFHLERPTEKILIG